MVRGPSPGPAPACQARASTRGSPGRGALDPPLLLDGGPCRPGVAGEFATHRADASMLSPPVPRGRHQRIILSPAFARPGASPRSRRGKREFVQAEMLRPEGAARSIGRRRCTKVIWIRSGCCVIALLFRGRFLLEAQEHLLAASGHNPTPSSVDSGLYRSFLCLLKTADPGGARMCRTMSLCGWRRPPPSSAQFSNKLCAPKMSHPRAVSPICPADWSPCKTCRQRSAQRQERTVCLLQSIMKRGKDACDTPRLMPRSWSSTSRSNILTEHHRVGKGGGRGNRRHSPRSAQEASDH